MIGSKRKTASYLKNGAPRTMVRAVLNELRQIGTVDRAKLETYLDGPVSVKSIYLRAKVPVGTFYAATMRDLRDEAKEIVQETRSAGKKPRRVVATPGQSLKLEEERMAASVIHYLKRVKDAEAELNNARAYIDHLEQQIKNCSCEGISRVVPWKGNRKIGDVGTT